MDANDKKNTTTNRSGIRMQTYAMFMGWEVDRDLTPRQIRSALIVGVVLALALVLTMTAMNRSRNTSSHGSAAAAQSGRLVLQQP